MGIASDYLEQAAETYGDYIDSHRWPYWVSQNVRVSSEESFVIFECPLCGQSFASDEEEKDHLIKRHTNQQIYLRVNGQIFNDICFAEGEIREFKVVSLSQERTYIALKLNNELKVNKDFCGSISLLDEISHVDDGMIEIKVTVPSLMREKSFVLYYNQMTQFENSEIDHDALRYLFIPLLKNAEPNFTSFQSHIQMANHPLERRYAEGLYNYSLAFYLNNKRKNAKEFFENALFGLLVFQTKFAITATRVLALRMNAFGFLKSCEPRSMFYLANCFFNNQNSQNLEEYFCYQKLNMADSEYGVYIDRETEFILQMLSAYYSRDFTALYILINAFEEEQYESNKNQLDKICLIKARTAELLGKKDEADMLYKELLINPIFEQEANRRLNA